MKILISLGITLLMSSHVWAWGDMGHKLVGGIAEQTMSTAAVNMVRGILGVEPVSTAAIWPDLVRDDYRFGTKTDSAKLGSASHDFSGYHFCEIPVGYTYVTKPKNIAKDCHSILAHAGDVIKNCQATREEKIIALRYLIHVAGDIHQPLHVGNGYDRGGNACQIQWKKTPTSFVQRNTLHAFWDETLVDEVRESFGDAANNVKPPKYFGDFLKALTAKHPELLTAEAKREYNKTSINDWLLEAATLRETIYPEVASAGQPTKKGEEYKNRPYCQWYVDQDNDKLPAPGSVIDETKIPVFTAAEAASYLPLVELQLFKGGLRLAGILDRIASEVKCPDFPKIDSNQEQIILESLHNSLQNIFSEPVK
ncbi:MAG: S1/P1 nuclease [Bdellovibrionaceae bacterium]|nr:S1/P1 nuclease [Bdellovibrio sp.]